MKASAATSLTALALLFVSASAGVAQECRESTAEGSGNGRDAALRSAFEAALRAADQGAWAAWNASGQRIGEVPGYAIRKLTNNCRAGGAGQVCRITMTLCRN
jgi:hypothetical protein